jgi:hypothetical protein
MALKKKRADPFIAPVVDNFIYRVVATTGYGNHIVIAIEPTEEKAQAHVDWFTEKHKDDRYWRSKDGKINVSIIKVPLI